METFTWHIGRSRGVRVLSRNPLVRWSDRVEALMTLVLMVTALLFVPMAGAIGTAVHESRADFYAHESAGRHTVTATVTDEPILTFENVRVAATASVRWRDRDAAHSDIIFVDPAVRVGDQVTIWVDRAGNHVSAPTASWQAGRDAVLAGVGAWLGVMAIVAGISAVVRMSLAHTRNRCWDREWYAVAVDDAGRTGYQR
jgi:hypothetical protein